MGNFNLGDGLYKVFLAGVGAAALTVEKTQEVVGHLIEKGEVAVKHGKAMNAELKRKIKEEKKAMDESVKETLNDDKKDLNTPLTVAKTCSANKCGDSCSDEACAHETCAEDDCCKDDSCCTDCCCGA